MCTEKQCQEMGEILCEVAMDIFEKCGAKDDFCVQAIGMSVVFGGTNRLFWNEKGFKIDHSYCNENFRRKFYELKAKGEIG